MIFVRMYNYYFRDVSVKIWCSALVVFLLFFLNKQTFPENINHTDRQQKLHKLSLPIFLFLKVSPTVLLVWHNILYMTVLYIKPQNWYIWWFLQIFFTKYTKIKSNKYTNCICLFLPKVTSIAHALKLMCPMQS